MEVLNGKDYVVLVDTDTTGSSPAWKALLCQTNYNLNQQKNTTQESPKCGVLAYVGDPTNTLSFDAKLPLDASTDAIGMKEFDTTYWASDKAFSFRIAPKEMTKPGTYGNIRQFSGKFTRNDEDGGGTEGYATRTVEVSIEGNVTYAEPIIVP